MTLATGGSAWAATSTRSSPLDSAWASASFVCLIPSCVPSSSINLTRGARMFSLIRVWGTGRTGSTNRLGLKDFSPSCWFLLQTTKTAARKQRPLSPSSRDSVEPPRSSAREVRRQVPLLLAGLQATKFFEQDCKRFRRLLSAVLADRERLLGLLVAVDDHVRDLLDLGVADPLADGLVRVVDLDAVGNPGGE